MMMIGLSEHHHAHQIYRWSCHYGVRSSSDSSSSSSSSSSMILMVVIV